MLQCLSGSSSTTVLIQLPQMVSECSHDEISSEMSGQITVSIWMAVWRWYGVATIWGGYD